MHLDLCLLLAVGAVVATWACVCGTRVVELFPAAVWVWMGHPDVCCNRQREPMKHHSHEAQQYNTRLVN